MSWRPTADIAALQNRAALLRQIREFFYQRDVLEVQTPLLGRNGITDPSIEPLIVERSVSVAQPRYLQTSPEYAMKRLLAAHGTPIFQICKAFRDGEAGSRHNPEFTLLEWYRPGFDYHQLMDEVAALIGHTVGELACVRYSYRQLFQDRLRLDPFATSSEELKSVANAQLDTGEMDGDVNFWLDLLMSHVIEPQLAQEGMCFVYNYPESQAALARVVEVDGVRVGQRFEVYVHGIELANGYCELTDADEQRARFEYDNVLREQRGQVARPIDESLLDALRHGLPDCSGVALGVDRLVLLATGGTDLRKTLSFDWERA